MSSRMTRSALALAALSALIAAVAGGAVAKDPVHFDEPGQPSKPYGKPYSQPGPKYGVLKAKSGKTTLKIDSALGATLAGVPITVSALAPGSGSFDFPITKARVVVTKGKKKGHGKKRRTTATKLAGYVRHSGGLRFAKTGASATLSNFRINLSAGKRGTLEGNVNGAKKRVRLGKLSGVSYDASTRTIAAKVTLTQRAANTLNGALGLGSTLSKTTVLGTLKVVPAFY